MKIAVRFGHQYTGRDGGSIGYVNEVDVNRRYGALVISKLKSLGHDVLNVTPTENNRSLEDSLSYGIDRANSWGAELFISCHVNAFQYTNNAMGCEVVVGSEKGNEIGKRIEKELVNLGFKSRGAKYDQRGLAEIKRVKGIVLIVEPFFLDSKVDVDLYKRVGDEGIANAIVKGITGQTSKATSSNSPRLLKLTNPLMYGEDIKEIQKDLITLGLKLDADGYYGCGTVDAVKEFQRLHSWLGQDGMVGEETRKAIKDSVNAKRKQEDKIHTVQIGAFKNKENAEKLLNELESKGFDGYIK